jgi:hypothetical protein
MIDDDDDFDDVLLFDEIDEEDVDEEARMRCTLVVGPAVTSDALSDMEAAYRREGFFPTMFIETGDDGAEILDNPETYALLMGLPKATPVTLEQAYEFERRNTSPDGFWTGG